METAGPSGVTALMLACGQGHEAVTRLLLQRGDRSIAADERYGPTANAVLQQWNNLSHARKEAIRRYDDWQYAEMPDEWTVQHHSRCPPHMRKLVAVAGIAWQTPLAAFNRKPGDVSHRLAEALYEHMGFRDADAASDPTNPGA